MEDLEKEYKEWEDTVLKKFLEKRSERKAKFTTTSNIEVHRIYTPLDLEVRKWNYKERLGFPGMYPFTRGIYPTMYRGRLWTFRQYSGYGSAEDTNRRYKTLLKEGQTGLSIAFDLPTQLGLDPDHPQAAGEVGRVGVSTPTVVEMDIVFKDIPMDKITTSMTINATAAEVLSMYLLVAESRGISWNKLGGTVQNDILKEYIARKNYIYPPEPSMRYTVDLIIYAAKHVPKWNPISISGYHIREAGSDAIQEIAFTIANGIEYVRQVVNRGVDIDSFAPRLSFFFSAHNNFFEEIAKFRAARRMWAKIMKEWFNAKKPESMRLRFHTQTAGSTLTAQQPEVNIIRTTIQALAAVLGGTQSLHVNSYDEAWSLPSEKAVTLSLRVQQVIAYESGVADTIDPLAGSYYVEWLTDEIEERAWKYIDKIEKIGGMIEAVKKGFPQREITETAYRFQKELEEGKRFIVGVNIFVEEVEEDIRNVPLLDFDQAEAERKQLERLKKVKEERDPLKVEGALSELRRAAEKNENIMPYVIKAVKTYATLGEIMGALKEVYGEWVEPPII